MRRLRAAVLLLALVAGSMLVSSGKAEASSGRASRPWRSVSAPALVLTLSDYVMQPPGNVPKEGEVDTLENEPPPRFPETKPPVGGPTTPFEPKFNIPDTTSRPDARHDSLFSVPGRAPVETIGPATTILPVPSSTQPSRPPGPRARRGILGVHPLAILVGLIALHIFVVTVAGK
jgi:hypothetical protein